MIFYSLSSEVWTAIYKGIRLLGLCTKPIIHIYSPGPHLAKKILLAI